MFRHLRSFRLSISNLMLLITIFAVLFAWRRDRQRVIEHYEVIRNARPPWATSQATGPPDTEGSGDIPTAWASATPDGQQEWLIAEFATAVVPSEVAIYETFNPGAVYRVTGLGAFGKETLLWEGTDPTPVTAQSGISTMALEAKLKFKRIKIYIDSPSVPGWNEIDAIGLKSKAITQWAMRVKASSTFGGF